MRQELDEKTYREALTLCEEYDARRNGLCEAEWPKYKHRKTGKIVKLLGHNQNYYGPQVFVARVEKDPNLRHIRTVPVNVFNFKRDYELLAERA